MECAASGSLLRVHSKKKRRFQRGWYDRRMAIHYSSVNGEAEERCHDGSAFKSVLASCCLLADDNDERLASQSMNSRLESTPYHERVLINVSGQLFEISSYLLHRHPSTLLGSPSRMKRHYDKRKKEYFFDRHRPSFEVVFAYLQYGGKLRRPDYIPEDVFLNEIEFFQLEEEAIEEYKISEGYTIEKPNFPENENLKKVWLAMEYPESSTTAYCIAIVSVIMTLVSIVLFCVETLERFAKSHCVGDESPNFLDPFFVIETICTSWFTFEVIVRFIACPSKWLFWFGFQNLIDFTAVIPYYVTLFNVLSTMSCSTAKSSASLAFLRVVRLVRIFKLTKHSTGLQVLVLTIKASTEELGLFLMVLLVCMLVYSSAIYYAELEVKEANIHSIPDAFWWAIITMTTVGYGDRFPVGVFGKIIGAACAISGVLALAMPVPILTGHFNRFYAHKTGRHKPM